MEESQGSCWPEQHFNAALMTTSVSFSQCVPLMMQHANACCADVEPGGSPVAAYGTVERGGVLHFATTYKTRAFGAETHILF